MPLPLPPLSNSTRLVARAFLLLGLLAAAFVLAPDNRSIAQGDRGERGQPGDFDYYTLVLSWSPTHCETEGRREGGQQCSGIRPYAFVLHGLWPQYEQNWPEFCRTRERPWVPQNVVDRMLDIMPSPGLVIHQYRKHGTCSGQDPLSFFRISRRAFESIKIPERFLRPQQPLNVTAEEVEKEFMAVNPQLQPDMIEVGCTRNRLRDVRICLTRDLQPRTCGDNELGRKLCAARRVTMPPVRYAPSGI